MIPFHEKNLQMHFENKEVGKCPKKFFFKHFQMCVMFVFSKDVFAKKCFVFCRRSRFSEENVNKSKWSVHSTGKLMVLKT